MTGLIICFAVQGVAARAVVLDATLGGKPYGTVTMTRGLVPGTGRERRVTFEGTLGEQKFTKSEHRVYKTDGTPVSFTFSYRDGKNDYDATAKFEGNKATVVYQFGKEMHTQESVLSVDKATFIDPTQAWFYGTAPKVGAVAHFWEYSIEQSKWVERTVTYEGAARVKVGDRNVDAHRVTVNKDVVAYVDAWGLPYRSTQETPKGKIDMTRRGEGK